MLELMSANWQKACDLYDTVTAALWHPLSQSADVAVLLVGSCHPRGGAGASLGLLTFS